MKNASDLHTGWRSALCSLAQTVAPTRSEPRSGIDPKVDDSDDAEREPFHLDDTELANRLLRDPGLIQYGTPAHAHLLFPDVVQP
jgi:hypothetical protein